MTVIRTRLDNGLVVLSEELHAAPVVALQAWVQVGSADETDDIAGIAHVHEHMLFKGTQRRGVGDIARQVEASGGEINAWTSFDQTVYHLVLAAGELCTGLDILADALTGSSFDASELSREIEVIVEEIKRSEDNPSRRIANALFAASFQKHPYRRPVIGTESTIRKLTRERVLEFFHQHYCPEKTTLVAVGDFDTAEVIEQARRTFGDWQRTTERATPSRPCESAQDVLRLRLLCEAVKEARLACAWHIPGVRHHDIAAMDALSVILGHGESSRLYQETRRRRELVNDIYAYAYTPKDPGLLMVGAGMRSDNLEEALISLLDEIYRMRTDRVSQEELEKAKVIILSEAAYQRETVQGEARKLGFFEVVAGDYAFEEQYYERLKALTPNDIREVARRFLHERPSLVVQIPQQTRAPDEAHIRERVADRFARASSSPLRSRLQGALDTTRVVLDNGAVLLVRHEESPVLALRALALGGLRWESSDTQGLSHLFACLWGQSTDSLSVDAMAQQVALFGGHICGFAGRNSVGLRGEFIREKADLGLELFADALLSRSWDDNDVERERAVILERIRNRDDNPAVVAFDIFAKTLFPKHPYGLRSIGTEESVRSFTRQDVLAYANGYASADKVALAIIGPVDVERTVDLFASRLRRTAARALPPAPTLDAPPTAPRRSQYVLDKKQAHIIVGAMGTTVDHPDRHALEVLTTILSGQSGRLFLDLRDHQSLAYAISSTTLEGLDPGHILVHVGTSPDKVGQALEAVYAHLARLREEPIPTDELERAKRYLIGTHSIDLQRAGARAMLMALGERFGLSYDQYTRYVDDVTEVSAGAVADVAERYLRPEHLVQAVVGPETPI